MRGCWLQPMVATPTQTLHAHQWYYLGKSGVFVDVHVQTIFVVTLTVQLYFWPLFGFFRNSLHICLETWTMFILQMQGSWSIVVCIVWCENRGRCLIVDFVPTIGSHKHYIHAPNWRCGGVDLWLHKQYTKLTICTWEIRTKSLDPYMIHFSPRLQWWNPPPFPFPNIHKYLEMTNIIWKMIV